MRIFLLKTIQRVVHYLLSCPQTSAWMWQQMPKLRHWFAQNSDGREILTCFDGDTNIWVSLTDHIESQIFWQGVQEADRGEVQLLKSLLKADHVFFDIGANIGVFSLMAAKRLTLGQVYAFEPANAHLKKLNANTSLNSFHNLFIHAIALSNSDRPAKLYIPSTKGAMHNTGMASLFYATINEAHAEIVQCSTLDEYIEKHRIPLPNVLKIDVEGAEMDVLEGAAGVLRTSRPHVVMEVNADFLGQAHRTVANVFEYWNLLDYKLYRIENNAELVPIESAHDLCVPQNIYCAPSSDQTTRWIER